MKQAFIDMVDHTVGYLAGTPGIWAWALLNEPWYWPHQLDSPYDGINQKENFIDLIQKLSQIVKTRDGRPVTIRFVNDKTWIDGDGVPSIKNIFTDDWGWDARIFGALDIISFNLYIEDRPEIRETWQSIAKENVGGSFERGKRVWITEFGYNSDDDTVQAGYYRQMAEFYRTLPIDGWLAWFWRGDTVPAGYDENPGKIGKGYNLCGSVEGIPRPAYYELL